MATILPTMESEILAEAASLLRPRGAGLLAVMRNAILRGVRRAAVRVLDLETEFEVLECSG